MQTGRVIIALVAVMLAGCASPSTEPALVALYSRAAQHYAPERNPVIVIPGILGSKLRDEETGAVVWGAFAGQYADPQSPQGARLVALPMREGAPLNELRDNVVPAGALDRLRVSILGLPVELSEYIQILGTLGVGGFRDETLGLAGAINYGDKHFTCFQFDYDWRRDNAENAARLHRFILEKRAYVQREIEKRFGVRNYNVKFDIVAHSMGGLLARYYLRYGDAPLPANGSLPPLTWAGSRYVERAILIAPPNAGAVEALLNLTRGRSFGPFLPRYSAALLGTMPAIYELLPRTRHGAVIEAGSERPLDILDPAVWETMRWGLAAPDEDRELQKLLPDAPDAAARRRVALDHLRKCLAKARQFQATLDLPAEPPPGLTLQLVAGDGHPTPAVAGVSTRTGQLRVLRHAPGDGEVLRSSALMDERVAGDWQARLVSPIHWSRVTFLFENHLGLTRAPAFTDNLLYQLLEQPR